MLANKRLLRGAAAALAAASFFLGPAVAQATALAEITPTIAASTPDAGGTFFGQQPDAKKVRHYYVAAEPDLWDFAPLGRDEMCGNTLPPPLQVNRKVSKLRYFLYTDGTFTTRVIADAKLGILGPVLRGVVGEYLLVTFLNRTEQPLSMHPHGVSYDKDSEGAYYRPAPGRGAAVGPGARFTYTWFLDESSGPRPDEPSSKGWLYHSHVAGDDEINQGLIGFIVVTDPARARPDGTPRDVDREFGALFLIFDESGLGADVKEAAEYVGLPGGAPPAKTWTQVQELTEQGSRYAINGYAFGNQPAFAMNEGERVRWYLFGLGSEQDFHTAHWHGLRVVEDGRRRTDVVELMPASMKVADLIADHPGTWMFHCHVAEHMREGMYAQMVVHAHNQVGADRSPAQAFLGVATATPSFEITEAAIVPGHAGAAPDRATLKLAGQISVFDAFSIFTQTVEVRLGAQTVKFRPDKTGRAAVGDDLFQVLNANPFGVIYGGAMEFALELRAPGWLDELKKNDLSEADSPTPPDVTLIIIVGEARHAGSIRFRRTSVRR